MAQKPKTKYIFSISVITTVIIAALLWFYLSDKSTPVPANADISAYIPVNGNLFLVGINDKNGYSDLFTPLIKKNLIDKYPDGDILANILINLYNYIPRTSEKGRSYLGGYTNGKEQPTCIAWFMLEEEIALEKKILQRTLQIDFEPVKQTYRGYDIWLYPLNNGEFISCFKQMNVFAASTDIELLKRSIDNFILQQPSLKFPGFYNALLTAQKSGSLTLLEPGVNYLSAIGLSPDSSRWLSSDVSIENGDLWISGYIGSPLNNTPSKTEETEDISANKLSERTFAGIQYKKCFVKEIVHHLFPDKNISVTDTSLNQLAGKCLQTIYLTSKDSIPVTEKIAIISTDSLPAYDKQENKIKVMFNDSTQSFIYTAIDGKRLLLGNNEKSLDNYLNDLKNNKLLSLKNPTFQKLFTQTTGVADRIVFGDGGAIKRLAAHEKIRPLLPLPIIPDHIFLNEISHEGTRAVYSNTIIAGNN
ncbi:hypothetical protein [Coprobacter tertius]|uniref:DUF3352 domain-containing protein n=1 Tax=Coprobacter tertius TaxID=2944915 RepID=A0ABT1MHF1_9BACT|nr:hypothetical protein [Coprobacter tertius]MCP9612060.1 hypothetical protein [Coprobacter tertius]